MLQPDLDAACSASDLAQSTVYYNFILIASVRARLLQLHHSGARFDGICKLLLHPHRARAQSHDSGARFDGIYLTESVFKSKEHNRSVQGGDLTNLQYKGRLSLASPTLPQLRAAPPAHPSTA
jgi:hypothetical protein